MPPQSGKDAHRVQLLDLTRPELAELLGQWGEPRYRADQLWRWLYRDLEADFTAMSNLPQPLRARLVAEASCQPLALVEELVSRDRRTRKALFRLADGETVETVLMLYEQRQTVCISTQVGCAIGCPFCATGRSGFVRNLTPGEIVAQVLHYARRLREEAQEEATSPQVPSSLSNVVVMGMGEPLANYEATWQALETLNDGQGFALGARHMTLSTAGLVPGIERMSQEKLQVGLAVSLHAPTDRLRNRLVPLNRRYPLAELMAACRRYVQRTGRRVTFEYALLQGINDSDEQAEQLARLLHGLLCHVNLIPVNPVQGSPYQPSSRPRAESFRHILQRAGIAATVRLRRGLDIEAGCGQLRQRRAIGN
ncbi:MAG: 23S rRNA (adenine(2503)-C(2))-methyltransferase RlmN [Anaerolineae bacterium]|nr:23S rRNA (adenine(2503)-C(2))-methyltransferase RlmN [Anaerolineae bacterium]